MTCESRNSCRRSRHWDRRGDRGALTNYAVPSDENSHQVELIFVGVVCSHRSCLHEVEWLRVVALRKNLFAIF